uniref:F-box domain-containing protein n=1 Tax=Caenorhabditis tropicalis TaxID=1561998 RepID=A0A1I7UMP6_9PELO
MTFPLHSLPNDAILNVIRNMEIYDQIAYSICSKTSERNVINQKLKVNSICLELFKEIAISVGLPDYKLFFNIIHPHPIIRCHRYNFDENRMELMWKTRAIGVRNIISHLCKVLNHPEIDEMLLSSSSINQINTRISMELIRELVQRKAIKILEVRILPQSKARNALQILRFSSILRLQSIPFERQEHWKWKKILAQNLEILSFKSPRHATIDDLLLANSEEISTTHDYFTVKQLNRFLKMWIIGASRRLKHFFIRITGSLTDDLFEALRGIQFERVPIDCDEVYRSRSSNYPAREIRIRGEIRIQRHDGTKAVVVLKNGYFSMISSS